MKKTVIKQKNNETPNETTIKALKEKGLFSANSPEEMIADALKEIAVVCKKTDGYGIIIEVCSWDSGVLGDKTNPAYAHLKTASGKYLGKFEITLKAPKNAEDVYDCDRNQNVPLEFKQKIVEWALRPSPNYDDEDGSVTNWGATKAEWRCLHGK